MNKMLFVVGTGTDVGKTYVTGLMMKKLRENGYSAGYYKAAMSGNRRRSDGSLIPGDAVCVKELAGISQPVEDMCPYVYEAAVSPHLAAEMEGNPVDMESVLSGLRKLRERYEYITMEGSGGILCPIRFDGTELWLADVIRACGAGCILVADAGLGTINQTGLTAYYMRSLGIQLKGIILNRYRAGDRMHEDNRKMCEYLTGVRVIACVREGDRELEISAGTLAALYEQENLQ